MNRPLAWFPLASSDPIPGDPAAVMNAGDRYWSIANSIADSVQALRAIAALDGYSSHAVEAVHDRAEEIATDIGKANHRYKMIGTALLDYAAALDRAQSDSVSALRAAQAAQASIDDASTSVRRASRAVDEAEADELSAKQLDLKRARHAVDEGEVALDRARQDLDEARAARDRAAEKAIEAIHEGKDDGLDDGWWQNWGSKVAHSISEIAGSIASVAGIASLFLGWVPILGEALAAVALIAGAVALIADIALLISGEGGWTNVILGVVGLASFGLGRVLSSGAKAAATGARGSARLAAGSAAATSPMTRAVQGLSVRSSLRAIEDMVGPELGSTTRAAARDMAAEGNALHSWSGVKQALATLNPKAVVKDLSGQIDGVFTMRPNNGTWQTLFKEGGSNIVTGFRTGPAAAISALSGDTGALNNLASISRVFPELAQVAPNYQKALTTLHWASGLSGAATVVDRGFTAYTGCEWVGGLGGEPGAAATLNLR